MGPKAPAYSPAYPPAQPLAQPLAQAPTPPAACPSALRSPERPALLAAVDLGSNSFRLELGRWQADRYERLHYTRETVRLGGALDVQGHLSEAGLQAGWDCLRRFATLLHNWAPERVAAVATQTLREARNAALFIDRGSALLGLPIRVISGLQEAQLIDLGVAQSLQDAQASRLVVDIGGRSTELIWSRAGDVQGLDSLPLGSVAWTQRYFADGRLSPSALAQAQAHAQDLLACTLSWLPSGVPEGDAPPAWTRAWGTAGTVNALVDVLVAHGHPAQCITRTGLTWLRDRLLAAGHVDALTNLAGLRADRRPIVGGGWAIVAALFDHLKIDTLWQAQGGLRHGLLLQLHQG